MEVTGELISKLERRAMEAERETIDRYVAAYLVRAGRRAGRLPDHRRPAVRLLRHGRGAGRRRAGAGRRRSAANISATTRRARRLVGDESGETFALGQRLTLRLAEANPVTGGLRFELPDAPQGAGRSRPPRGESRVRGPASGRRAGAAGRPISATRGAAR